MKGFGHATKVVGLTLLLAVSLGCPGNDGDHTARNTLNWQAATEEGLFGYLVYRSENRDGPFRRTNEQIIRVPADRLDQHDYSWVDGDVESGKTYYYYLDAVSVTGIKQRFSGIIDRTTP